MARVLLGARVTDAQADALRGYAGEAGVTFYQATVRAIEIGITVLTSGGGTSPGQVPPAGHLVEADKGLRDTVESLRGMIEGLCETNERLAIRTDLITKVAQRGLYAAGAAYAAALAGPGKGDAHMAEIARDADRIFERQLAKAQEK